MSFSFAVLARHISAPVMCLGAILDLYTQLGVLIAHLGHKLCSTRGYVQSQKITVKRANKSVTSTARTQLL